MYFANDNPAAPTDRGVGTAFISHDQDTNGNYTTTLHKSYFLPDYVPAITNALGVGGRGSETCIKVI